MNPLRKVMTEAVVIKGNNKYMSRNGKFYHYDQQGKRSEISQDEYEKVLGPRVSGRPDVGAKAQNKNSVALTIDGKKYSASVDGMSAKDLAAHVQDIAKHSPGRAIQWLKKNGTVTHVGEKSKPSSSEKTKVASLYNSIGNDTGEYDNFMRDLGKSAGIKVTDHSGYDDKGSGELTDDEGNSYYYGPNSVNFRDYDGNKDITEKYDGTTDGLSAALKKLKTKSS